MMSSRRFTEIVLISPNLGLISDWIVRKDRSPLRSRPITAALKKLCL